MNVGLRRTRRLASSPVASSVAASGASPFALATVAGAAVTGVADCGAAGSGTAGLSGESAFAVVSTGAACGDSAGAGVVWAGGGEGTEDSGVELG